MGAVPTDAVVDKRETLLDEWKHEARKVQQGYFLLLGDRLWDDIGPGEEIVLRRKIGFGLHGPPFVLPSDANKHTGYEGEKLELIDEISNKLTQPNKFSSEGIHFACIYILACFDEKSHTIPLFKAKAAKTESDSCMFVDTCARVYSSWDDWVNNEKLPACTYCAPMGGSYVADPENEVMLSYSESLATSVGAKVVNALDDTTSAISWAATGLFLASFFVPIARPLATALKMTAGTATVYGAGRGIQGLVDRGKHGQTINVADRDAREHWLDIFGGAMSAGVGLVVKISRKGRLYFRNAKTGNVTISGLGIAHGLEHLADKIEKGELSSLDIFQFTATVLFFSHAALSLSIARSFAEKKLSVRQVLSQKVDFGKSQEDFSIASDTGPRSNGRLEQVAPNEIPRKKQVVRSLRTIENERQLYDILVDKSDDK
ncbi:uncharacterized protein LOC100898406 [Galendromus occidentalis]|uniref:Uncharacterized protein LOC100898406 n=1 Tax=Galendromus occidentalis TaxID=34638 RepID=A0AAJ6VWY4_9ACAR|nr:uncharacterized protein LOC100898406 [Galendromus occidentalis]